MRGFQLPLLLVCLLGLVAADVSLIKPEPGLSFDASGGLATIDIEWEDDSAGMGFSSLDQALQLTIVLMTGSNDKIGVVKQVGLKLGSDTRSFSADISNTVGPNGYYFFQVYTQFPNLGYTIHYTNRFRLTGMTGLATTFTFGQALFTETGLQPQPQWNAGGTALKINSAMFTVPYSEQTGWIKYAPMQPNPTAPITATRWNDRHGTSAFTVFKTPRSFPNVYTTVTPDKTYTISTKENSAPVMPGPTYFYPASSRVLLATLSSIERPRWL